VRAAAALSDLVPVRWVLVAEADGHRIAWRTPDGRQCGVVGLEDVAVIARRWGIRHDWAASRADYVADIDSRPDLVAAVQEMLGARTAVEISLDDVIAHTCGWLEATHDEVPPRDPAAIAAILAALADVRVRDTVLWELMQREPWAWAHAAERLAHVVAGAPRGHAAPAACVLAVLRWQVGDGSRASAAIERALDDDPTYSLALLIDRCLGVAMHPQAWREGILAMARDDCRRSA
jgi:hypothetical protein